MCTFQVHIAIGDSKKRLKQVWEPTRWQCAWKYKYLDLSKLDGRVGFGYGWDEIGLEGGYNVKKI